MALLKTGTAAYHAKLESLPYFGELIAHQLPLECYVNQLRALGVIHNALEEQLAASANQQIADVWEDGLRKLPLLLEDLDFFAPRIPSDNSPTIEIALSIADKIRMRGIEQPLSLLGYLYVMEGSTLGNQMHQPDITKSYQLDGLDGSRYYSSYKGAVTTHWQQFTARMNQALDDPAAFTVVVDAAHEAFAGLELLYKALFPLQSGGSRFHVVRINLEAGNHPIPADKREIEAALKASDRCWNAYPYYQNRYGARGKRFSDSDTCWLATLPSLDQISLQKQVDWLCRLLAPRGMPSLMLESLLEYLAVELTRAVPENQALFDKLLKSSQKLKERRLKHIEETVYSQLAEDFEQSVAIDMMKGFENTGLLVLSAVIDEHNGIPGGPSGILNWLIDPARFPKPWIAAVEQTINKAKKSVL